MKESAEMRRNTPKFLYYCETHHRLATSFYPKGHVRQGEARCDENLGGIMFPCLTMKFVQEPVVRKALKRLTLDDIAGTEKALLYALGLLKVEPEKKCSYTYIVKPQTNAH